MTGEANDCWHCGRRLQRKRAKPYSTKVEYWYVMLSLPTGEEVKVHKGCFGAANLSLWPQGHPKFP